MRMPRTGPAAAADPFDWCAAASAAAADPFDCCAVATTCSIVTLSPSWSRAAADVLSPAAATACRLYGRTGAPLSRAYCARLVSASCGILPSLALRREASRPEQRCPPTRNSHPAAAPTSHKPQPSAVQRLFCRPEVLTVPQTLGTRRPISGEIDLDLGLPQGH